MSQRRIVMGRRGGRDRIVFDELIDPVALADGGVTAHPIWGRDRAASVPADGFEPEQGLGFPASEGFRYAVLTIPAQSNEAYYGYIDTALAPFVTRGMPGMHWTPTVDCIVVTQGELLLESDDDAVTVRAGDSVIINGNRHRWSNSGLEAAVLHAISLGVAAGPG